jgi:hypothetical protein
MLQRRKNKGTPANTHDFVEAWVGIAQYDHAGIVDSSVGKIKASHMRHHAENEGDAATGQTVTMTEVLQANIGERSWRAQG